MKEKILIIHRDAKEERFPLNKERVLIGRDPSCDIVWKEAEFSREHIAIHFKHDTVYIENISTGGSIKINGKDAEYAELREGVEVGVGPYILKWIYVSVVEKALSNLNPLGQTHSGVKAFASAKAGDSNEALNESQGSLSALDLSGDLPALKTEIQVNSGDIAMSSEDFEAFAHDDTMKMESASVGLLKVISGEIIDREIHLEHGKEWIVGRAKECHVAIDNPKLSRHHFKILQIGNGFRVQDLDSSYGVKVNGVGVKEAPLKSYDKINAGPVELRFAIIDKNHNKSDTNAAGLLSSELGNSLPALVKDNVQAPRPSLQQNLHSERTQYPPVPNAAPYGNFQFTKPSLENSQSQGNFVSSPTTPQKQLPKDRIIIFFAKFKEQPASRKALLVILPLLLIAGALLSVAPPEPEKVVEVVKKEDVQDPKEETSVEDNPAESTDYSAEYQLKSPKEKSEIQSLYAQAEEARNRGDWTKAHEHAQEIVRRVGKYKRTAEIIAEAQGYLTDLQIATLSRSDNDTETAAAAAQQRIQELLSQGEVALSEKRFEDAQEIYSKALLIDPKNDLATRGQYAAQAKDPAALGKELPIERGIAKENEDKEADEELAAAPTPPPENSIETMSQEFQNAKQKIQEGAFRDALPTLMQLKTLIERKIAEDEASRNPAAILSEDKRNLRSKIMESIDLINDQFVLEYKTQMDDAQQGIANQKYVEARAIYDTLIKREPLFEEPRIEREKLYRKMMSDGQSAYREGLVSESVGDLSSALELYEKAKSYFENINKKEAEEYYAILDKKLRILKK